MKRNGAIHIIIRIRTYLGHGKFPRLRYDLLSDIAEDIEPVRVNRLEAIDDERLRLNKGDLWKLMLCN